MMIDMLAGWRLDAPRHLAAMKGVLLLMDIIDLAIALPLYLLGVEDVDRLVANVEGVDIVASAAPAPAVPAAVEQMSGKEIELRLARDMSLSAASLYFLTPAASGIALRGDRPTMSLPFGEYCKLLNARRVLTTSLMFVAVCMCVFE